MKKKLFTLTIIAAIFGLLFACKKKQATIDITPHPINLEADKYYQEALSLMASTYDVDSTRKCLKLLDKALNIDSLNPDYYGVKAKLLSEMGLLDSALAVQHMGDTRGAITGEYLFQLGLFQAAKNQKDEAHKSFKRSNDFLLAVLKKYPDSLGAFILQQAAMSLYHGEDSLFMQDVTSIRERFPKRVMEIELTRRVKPHHLIKQIQDIAEEEQQSKSEN